MALAAQSAVFAGPPPSRDALRAAQQQLMRDPNLQFSFGKAAAAAGHPPAALAGGDPWRDRQGAGRHRAAARLGVHRRPGAGAADGALFPAARVRAGALAGRLQTQDAGRRSPRRGGRKRRWRGRCSTRPTSWPPPAATARPCGSSCIAASRRSKVAGRGSSGPPSPPARSAGSPTSPTTRATSSSASPAWSRRASSAGEGLDAHGFAACRRAYEAFAFPGAWA